MEDDRITFEPATDTIDNFLARFPPTETSPDLSGSNFFVVLTYIKDWIQVHHTSLLPRNSELANEEGAIKEWQELKESEGRFFLEL